MTSLFPENDIKLEDLFLFRLLATAKKSKISWRFPLEIVFQLYIYIFIYSDCLQKTKKMSNVLEICIRLCTCGATLQY